MSSLPSWCGSRGRICAHTRIQIATTRYALTGTAVLPLMHCCCIQSGLDLSTDHFEGDEDQDIEGRHHARVSVADVTAAC